MSEYLETKRKIEELQKKKDRIQAGLSWGAFLDRKYTKSEREYLDEEVKRRGEISDQIFALENPTEWRRLKKIKENEKKREENSLKYKHGGNIFKLVDYEVKKSKI